MKTDQVKAIEKAAEALSDLNTFGIVVSTLEGGHLHAPSNTAAQRIIKICLAEQQKRLRDYDHNVAKATCVLVPWAILGFIGAVLFR